MLSTSLCSQEQLVADVIQLPLSLSCLPFWATISSEQWSMYYKESSVNCMTQLHWGRKTIIKTCTSRREFGHCPISWEWPAFLTYHSVQRIHSLSGCAHTVMWSSVCTLCRTCVVQPHAFPVMPNLPPPPKEPKQQPRWLPQEIIQGGNFYDMTAQLLKYSLSNVVYMCIYVCWFRY